MDTKKTVKKPAKKTMTKKSTKKTSNAKKSSKKTVVVKAITDSSGVVTMASVEDPGTATEGEAASLTPTLDKETEVITMVISKS